MTTQPVPPSRSTRPLSGPGVITLTVRGDLDYETCGDLLDDLDAALEERPDADTLLVDCARMTLCDSMGLSTLLQIRRRADAAGIRLLLDPRPGHLDRLLRVTGTADHLLGGLGADGDGSPDR